MAVFPLDFAGLAMDEELCSLVEAILPGSPDQVVRNFFQPRLLKRQEASEDALSAR